MDWTKQTSTTIGSLNRPNSVCILVSQLEDGWMADKELSEWVIRLGRNAVLKTTSRNNVSRNDALYNRDINIYIPKLLDFRLVKCCNFLTYFTLFNPAIFNKKSIASQRNVRGVCLAFDIQIWLVSNILHPHSGNMILYRSRFSEVGLNYCT